MEREDRKNIGLGDSAYEICVQLRDDGVFTELRDVYRLGIAVAIAKKGVSAEIGRIHNMADVGGLDPDQAIRSLIIELYPDQAERPYAFAERLADYGVQEIGRLYETGELRWHEFLTALG